MNRELHFYSAPVHVKTSLLSEPPLKKVEDRRQEKSEAILLEYDKESQVGRTQ